MMEQRFNSPASAIAVTRIGIQVSKQHKRFVFWQTTFVSAIVHQMCRRWASQIVDPKTDLIVVATAVSVFVSIVCLLGKVYEKSFRIGGFSRLRPL